MKKFLAYLLVNFSLILFGCSDYEHSPLQGYIEGEYTLLSSPVAGKLIKLAVTRGDQVTPGQLIFSLERDPEADQTAKVAAQTESSKAQYQDALLGQRSTVILALIAQRDQAKAALDLAQRNYERNNILFRKGVISQQAYDETASNLKSAQRRVDELEANIKEAQQGQRQFKIVSQYYDYRSQEAQLSEAQWRLRQKNVYAPDKGFIFDTFFNEGEQINVNQAVASLLSPENIFVIFFIPEPVRSKYRVGDNIMFTCDSCNERFPAKIVYLSPQAEFTPPVIFSRESRAKLVFRVRAALPSWVTERVFPGQPVEVYIRKENRQKKRNSILLFTQSIFKYFNLQNKRSTLNGI